MSRALSPIVVSLALVACQPDPTAPAAACAGAACATLEHGRQPTMWGFADLHAHPASHLAFGADKEKGGDGILHGSPGLVFHGSVVADEADLQLDLPACDAEHHQSSADPIQDAGREAAFSGLDTSGGKGHLEGGADPFQTGHDFEGWPDARSVTHQQMHVQWLHRAWEGGLRLMVASTVDSQVVSAIWGKGLNQPIQDELGDAAEKDYASAVAQLDFIQELASHNVDWMGVATTPEMARALVLEGKLALVLATEQDHLTGDQILDLRKNHGLGLVIPIHLLDNELGGTAAYSDLFDTATKFTMGDYIQVESDPSVRFRYGAPSYFEDVPIGPGFIDFVSPENDYACDEGLESCDIGGGATAAGQVNALGLTPDGRSAIAAMMNAGLVVDVSHMSDKARGDTLDIAETCGVPVVDSHTDLRPDLVNGPLLPARDPRSVNERSLRVDHLDRIHALGGMIGLGTSEVADPVVLFEAHGNPLHRMGDLGSGDANLVTSVLSVSHALDEAHLTLLLKTGGDDMRGLLADGVPDSTVVATVTLADGTVLEHTLTEQRDGDTKTVHRFEDHSYDWVTVPLPGATTVKDVASLSLTLSQPGSDDYNADNWNLAGMEVYYVDRDEAVRLFSVDDADGKLHRFSKNWDNDGDHDGPTMDVPLDPDPREVVLADVWTNGDDLRCGTKATLWLEFTDGTAWTDDFERRFSPRDGLPDHQYFERPLALPKSRTVEEIASIAITHDQVDPDHEKCVVFVTSDNWDVSRVRLRRPTPGGTVTVLDRHADKAFRFTEQSDTWEIAADPTGTSGLDDTTVRFVRVRIRTGQDDVKAGGEVTATLGFAGLSVDLDLPMNHGAKWADRTEYWEVLDLGMEVPATALTDLELSFDPVDGDEWKISDVWVEAVTGGAGDLLETWELARTGLGADPAVPRRVAFGTDLNGMQPTISFAEVALAYPLALPTPPGTVQHPPFVGHEQHALSRVFDFQHEGLSNVGQLPELAAAMGELAGDPEAMAPLFRTAGDFVELWQKVVDANAAGKVCRP